jgi:hypothetical protein
MGDDVHRVKEALAAAGVDGVEDFGLFVGDTRHFAIAPYVRDTGQAS